MIERKCIRLTGRVQGVGFRPAVARLAREAGLTGWVGNDAGGVTLEVQGSPETLAGFLRRLEGPGCPPMARIERWRIDDCPVLSGERDFVIRSSRLDGPTSVEVTTDLAVCGDCLRELRDPQDFRYGYPFINCTQCGPRYSIVRSVPYDRPRTTMAAFRMCARCRRQYHDVNDRRFHAQPVACPDCGPRVWLSDPQGQCLGDRADAIERAAQALWAGHIVAVKGLGGFHLAVDACQEAAVDRLRRRKRRDAKPFALMAADLDGVRRCVVLEPWMEELLAGPEAPILVARQRPGHGLASSVARDMDSFGVMLPYTPLHRLLFDHAPPVLVMTSANFSHEPLIADNEQALAELAEVADVFLMHDRPIHRPVDDSIVSGLVQPPIVLRRARGWVPTPLYLPTEDTPDILAMGADLKNTFCLVKRGKLLCSEHIGDLDDARVFRHYQASIEHFCGLFDVHPTVVAHDLHPAYHSTVLGRTRPAERTVAVQHHWAHVVACLAEAGIDRRVIAVVADGTGYGPDGAIWGGECLLADWSGYERLGHVRYFPLPGGDAATREAVRPLLGLLGQVEAGDLLNDRDVRSVLEELEPDNRRRQVIGEQLRVGLNCVFTSSVGRVFDAAAALCGCGTRNRYDAELPMVLEALAEEPGSVDPYPFTWSHRPDGPAVLDAGRFIVALLRDRLQGRSRAHMAGRFHRTWVEAWADLVQAVSRQTGLTDVVLAGGVFCNRWLLGGLTERLRQVGLHVWVNQQIPLNDGGVSVGQAAIAYRHAVDPTVPGP